MNGRPPHLSPPRLVAGLLLPWLAYLIIRSLIGSSVGALAITDALPATWLLVFGIARRRIEPIAVLSAATVFIALAAYAISGGDPVAIKLRRGAVTGAIGVAALTSFALGRPLLLLVAQNAAKLNVDRPELAARLAEPHRRRMLRNLTAIIGATFAIDGASQILLALTVPTASFIADSTGARIAVLGSGAVITIQYLRNQKRRLDRGVRGTVQSEARPIDTVRDHQAAGKQWGSWSAVPSCAQLASGRQRSRGSRSWSASSSSPWPRSGA